MAHRSDEILQRLHANSVIGAEVGVFSGATSARILRRPDLTLFMVDPWKCFIADNIVIADDAEQERNYRSALAATDFAAERRHVVRRESVDAAAMIEDGALDFVFIDGDHSHSAVSADIKAWLKKIKHGGLLCGHDYANPDYDFGQEVKRAVDEFADSIGKKVETGGDYTWFVRL